MARSIQQIRDSISGTLRSIDRRIDLKVGPTWDYLLAPVPYELSPIETEIARLFQYYSPNFASVCTPEEARDFSNNFGAGSSVGEYAKATVVFYRNSPPPFGKTYTVPTGTLVLTVDNNVVFSTTQSAEMSGNFASMYYNPTTKRYEIRLPVQAVNAGEKYNIPKDHLKRMQPPIDGFDGVAQITDAEGGSEPETAVNVALRTQDKFKGLDINSVGGIVTQATSINPTQISQVSVVRPTDRVEFRRLTSGPALDLYIRGQTAVPFIEEYLSVGGETVVPIVTNKTVTSITSVTVAGQVLTPRTQWVLRLDDSLEYKLSTEAKSYIQLAFPLDVNVLVEFEGERNYLLDTVQTRFSKEATLFGTDILVRSYVELPLIVSLEVKINSGDPDTIAEFITVLLLSIIEPSYGIPTYITPDMARDQIKSSIPEVESIKFLEFRRQFGSLASVETITPNKSQMPKYNIEASTITVRM